jgi:hypothetical protein
MIKKKSKDSSKKTSRNISKNTSKKYNKEIDEWKRKKSKKLQLYKFDETTRNKVYDFITKLEKEKSNPWLSRDEFISIFNIPNISFAEFRKTWKRRMGDKTHDLTNYSNADLLVFYNTFIKNGTELIGSIYDTFFAFEEPVKYIPIDNTNKSIEFNPKNLSNKSYHQCKRPIRNLHFKSAFVDTKTAFEFIDNYIDVLIDFYNGYIDAKLLTPSGISFIKKGNVKLLLSGFYFRTSILNPHLILNLSLNYLHGERIFTPTLGWSSYMYGFLSNPEVKEYVGVDVIPSVCKKTREFAKILDNNNDNEMMNSKKVEIYCQPSESLYEDKDFMKTYKNHFDIIFFSPPYYTLEEYPGKKQSTEMYKTYEEWLEKYWDKTIQLCHHVLKNDGKMAYIINCKGSLDFINMGKDMNKITEKYFNCKNKYPLGNVSVGITRHKEQNEFIFIFTKK